MGNASISRRIFIVLIILFIFSLFGGRGTIAGFAALDPVAVVERLQLWRVLTYPLSVDFVGLLVATICFTAPSEEIEHMLGGRRFLVLLLAVVLLAAVLHIAMFLGTGTVLEGPANPALFMLIGFVYLFPDSEIRLLFFSVRSWLLLSFLAATLAFVTTFLWLQSGTSPLLFFSYGGFGMVLGTIYFHVRFQKYSVLLRPIRSLERMVNRSDDDRANGSGRRTPTVASRVRMPFQRTQPKEVNDQERLDGILDRINEKGYSSLSEDDRAFLREYSGRL